MIEYEITDEMLCEARKKSIEMGELRNSITKGQGNLVGFIGESIVLKHLGGEWSNTYDYDIILPDGRTVDVKTKQTTVEPLPTYEASVAALNTQQNCDLYAFVRVKKDLSVGWYLGYMPKKEYFKRAKFLKKGETDPSNNFKVRSDCYNMEYKDMYL